MSGDIVFEMKVVTKEFPDIKALDRVSFTVRAAEVHALSGKIGAGKSTLMKVLSGVSQADKGDIYLRGERVAFHHLLELLAQGVSVIYQEFSLRPDRTVAQNIFLGCEPVRCSGVLDADRMRRETQKVLALFEDHHRFGPDTRVGELDVTQQQMVEIAKELSLNIHVIVMDAEGLDDKQIADLEDLLAGGTCDALIVSPNTTAALTRAVESACEQLPAIVFDRSVNTDCPVTFIKPVGGNGFGISPASSSQPTPPKARTF
ncbi:ATP-binding cassette domain-containing protein [Ruegeria hyattellae]|uniref:ATP-binding cassette domain-containing protein n=1 Tax=Ruegeria hyattellae TaxID=3233337 RepID=UPI00355C0290